MKAITLVCAVGLFGGCAVDGEELGGEDLASDEQAATQSDVWHSTWNGASANASLWGQYGSAYVDVFENGTGASRSAYLNLSFWSVDPTSEQCFTYTDWWYGEQTYCYFTRFTYGYAWGQIPAGDAQITPNHAHLKTTVGASFGGYQCTYDYANWNFECGAPTGGSVDIQWRKDGQASYFSSGTQQQTYGVYSFKTQGTYRASSARASGSVFGATFENSGWGQFGDTRGVNVSKSIVKAPKP